MPRIKCTLRPIIKFRARSSPDAKITDTSFKPERFNATIVNTNHLNPLKFITLFSAAISSLASQQVQALEPDEKHHWALGIGVGTYSIPDYPGSSHIKHFTAPIPYISYQGPHFRLANGKISSLVFKSKKLLIDISADGTPPVKSKNNPTRDGMPDLDPVLELGPELEYHFWANEQSKLYLSLPVHYGFAISTKKIQSVSWLCNPRLKYHFSRKTWKLRLGAGPVYASRRHHNFYYGITLSEVGSERPAYQAGSGFGGLRYSVGVQKKWAHLKYDAYFRYSDLEKAHFSNSPLLKKKYDLLGGIAVTWIFTEQ